ncbi:competence protein CoiA family protein [Faecalibacter macacae]|uniref:Competence protein n=1 Tax=Faecalibacter macacae TaxID=1859289 RepID=A0A3L9MGM8_9FLAO|nr:competence protein CoiA family protein [Faecalibacter macacae]RLZ09729.1 hypothetical protein EAH69_08045 [Faecalibacter macacae]
MKFALDENKRRIKPTKSGQKAFCPLCDGLVIGKCGEIYEWHWQHKGFRDCDSWNETETEWHLNWKSKFPENWQEIIIENDNEKHIADIKTKKGLVIEFQNSNISSSTIKIRENFYQDMIWVVNAIGFKNNLKCKSLVSTNLKELGINQNQLLNSVNELYTRELKTLSEEYKEISEDVDNLLDKVKLKQNKVNRLKEREVNFIEFSDSIIKKWIKDAYIDDYETDEIRRKIDLVDKTNLKNIRNNIHKLQDIILKNEEKLKAINNLENYDLEGIIYKIVPYNKISSTSFYKTIAILKESKNSLFPKIIQFKNEMEFKRISSKIEQYEFAINLTIYTDELQKDTEINNQKIIFFENSFSILKDKISNELYLNLKNLIKEITKEINDIKIIISNLKDKLKNLEDEKLQIFKNQKIEQDKSYKKLEKDYIDKKFQIMKDYKGIYKFHWKNERKSWKESNCTIYFDIGESYLLKRIDEDRLKKIEIKDFMNFHLGN